MTNLNLKDKSLIELTQMIDSGEITSKEVWDYFIGRIQKYDEKIKSYNFVNTAGFKDKTNSILKGLPIGVKDIFCENGILTTCASKMLIDFKPPYDATVITKLNESGMNSIGKLNMDEFAMGSTSESSAIQTTINPWGENRIPGGSSGGSARRLAAGLCPASLGTDTGGSIRQPASMCSIVGFKPSYGRNSRYGVIPMASSLDCPGTFTKTVRDAGLLYDIMNGYDEKEDTSIDGKDKIDDNIWNKKDLKGVKIGLPKEYFEEGIDEGVKQTILKAVDDLKNMGAEIIDITLPMTKYAIATYYLLMPAEVSTNLGRFDGLRYGHNSTKYHESMDEFYINNRSEGFGDEATRRIILGSYVLSAGFYDAYYKKASQIRNLIIQDFQKAFEKVDVIVSPVSPSVAWKIGEKVLDPLKMYLSDAYTIPASLAGLPGISVPCGFAESTDLEKENLPVGLQILASHMQDQKVLEVAHVYETNTNWSKQNPPGFE